MVPLQAVARVFLLARRVVGHRQQEVALDAALGEERDAAIVFEAFFAIGGARRFHVAGDRVVRRRAFGDADQDPVARGRREPHLELVVLALVVTQADDGVAGDGGRLELDQRDAVVADLDLRVARTGREDLVVVELLDFPHRAVRRIERERGGGAGARGLAVLVEHAQRDHRARTAIGDELRRGLVDLGAHRAAAEVHRAFGLPQHLAVGIDDASRRSGSRRRPGSRARQRLSADRVRLR